MRIECALNSVLVSRVKRPLFMVEKPTGAILSTPFPVTGALPIQAIFSQMKQHVTVH